MPSREYSIATRSEIDGGNWHESGRRGQQKHFSIPCASGKLASISGDPSGRMESINCQTSGDAHMVQDGKAGDILVVDDKPANLKVLTSLLTEQNYTVRPVTSGPLALRAARGRPPDVILLDINMPGMNGYEVCRRLKETSELKDIPVLFVSALSEPLDKVEAFSAGGVDYITKPFQMEEVQARIATHLRLRRFQLQLEEQNRTLQESNERLRELEALRDNLTNMIVHDMRSPITVILLSLQFLNDDLSAIAPAGSQEDIRRALASTRRLLHMIGILLDVSRLEARKLPLNLKPCRLCGTIREAIEDLRAVMPGRALDMCATDDEIELTCDGELIRRVLDNLIHNALKFTPEGGSIHVAISRIRDGVRIQVRDTGPGIPPEYRTKVFDKFWQDAPKSKAHSSGLGLAFCRLAVEAHNGRIGVDSEVGQGSTFWFELPVQ